MRHVFGIHHTYGPNTINGGNVANILVRFRFRRHLLGWIDQDREHREAVDSRHPYVRLAQRQPEDWEGNEMRIAD